MDVIPPPVEETEPIAEWRLSGLKILGNLYYNGALELINFLFTFSIIFTGNEVTFHGTGVDITTAFALLIQFIFLVDMIANIVVLRLKHIKNIRASIKFEFFLQLLGLLLICLDMRSNDII